jgi:hypothetical protein
MTRTDSIVSDTFLRKSITLITAKKRGEKSLPLLTSCVKV